MAGAIRFGKAAFLRILIADDQEPVRRRLCATLAARSNFEVCGEAADGQEAVRQRLEGATGHGSFHNAPVLERYIYCRTWQSVIEERCIYAVGCKL